MSAADRAAQVFLLPKEVADDQAAARAEVRNDFGKRGFQLHILETLAEQNRIVRFGGVEIFVLGFEDTGAIAEYRLSLAVQEGAGADAVDFMTAADELGSDAAGTAADIKDAFQIRGNMF